MKISPLILVLGALATLLAGCNPPQKTLSERDVKEAATLSSEAQFAMRLREWPRAEKILLDAIKITPDPVFYHNLGLTRMRLNNRAGAKEAYQKAIESCDRLIAANKAASDPVIKKVHLLALAGRVEDARALVRKLDQDFPQDRVVRAFIDGKKLDEFINSPNFKDNALQ